MVLAVSLCLTAAVFSDQLTSDTSNKGLTMEYESVLFDTSEIISINIVIGEDDWNEMLDNATAEEYYRCDVVVNGETFYGVGIRPKGNTSLIPKARTRAPISSCCTLRNCTGIPLAATIPALTPMISARAKFKRSK